ncbi:MAG: RsmB/NOP family class I SAM-dependent RNA methyltransferase [Anaerolineales bacterium]|jgi:16S rRNA C967 or C1407 C5-methylase (RsmB/RsmF family)/NOL1/NOP2/fmu family ribosome biogenesis protein
MPPNQTPPIPALFLERMSRLLGDEYATFAAALEEEPVSGLRVNTLKLSPEEFRTISPFPLGDKVAWCDSAFNLKPDLTPMLGASPAPSTLFPNTQRPGTGERGHAGIPYGYDVLRDPKGRGEEERKPGKHPYHLAGLYYLQDPSAMSAAALLNPQPGERILDLAASPGGKTTQLAALMQGKGLLVANEIKDKRLGHLAFNVERWGAGNVVITNETPERLADHFGAYFERVLVDAPCSGEGMFRKEMSARRDWSLEMVAGCAIRQRNVLRVAAKLVRPGGYLMYSTCTFAPEEDETIIARFLEDFPEYESIPIPLFPGFVPGRPDWMEALPPVNGKRKQKLAESILHDSLKNAVRLFPHRLVGEGHFVCLLKRTHILPTHEHPRALFQHQPARLTKRTIELWKRFTEEVLRVVFPEERLRVVGDRLYLVQDGMPDLRGLRVVHPGVWLGTFKKERFEPAHPLAVFLRPGQARNGLDLPADSRELAAYLRGETIRSDGTPGWTLVSVEGWPLGWGKRVQGMLKNHYPKGWQIYS